MANDPPTHLHPKHPKLHAVPSVHITADDGALVIAAVGAVADLKGVSIDRRFEGEAPVVAGFSSRGPCLTDSAAMIKPDIMAPGERVHVRMGVVHV